MSVNRVNCCENSSSTYYLNYIDEEEKAIMRKLRYIYGVIPTGTKSIDKAKLHTLELQEFKTKKIVSNKYLTLTTEEQKKYLESLKIKNKEANKGTDKDKNKKITEYNNPGKMFGAKLQGEQKMQAIRLKYKK